MGIQSEEAFGWIYWALQSATCCSRFSAASWSWLWGHLQSCRQAYHYSASSLHCCFSWLVTSSTWCAECFSTWIFGGRGLYETAAWFLWSWSSWLYLSSFQSTIWFEASSSCLACPPCLCPSCSWVCAVYCWHFVISSTEARSHYVSFGICRWYYPCQLFSVCCWCSCLLSWCWFCGQRSWEASLLSWSWGHFSCYWSCPYAEEVLLGVVTESWHAEVQTDHHTHVVYRQDNSCWWWAFVSCGCHRVQKHCWWTSVLDDHETRYLLCC